MRMSRRTCAVLAAFAFIVLVLLASVLLPVLTRAQQKSAYKIIAPDLVQQGEEFTARVVEETEQGERPLQEGDQVSVQGQVVDVQRNGKIRLPSFVKEVGNVFIIATILRATEAGQKEQGPLPTVTEHVEVVPPSRSGAPVPPKIARSPEIVTADRPIRIEGQNLAALDRAALVAPDGKQVELNDSVGSSLQRIYFPPERTPIPKGAYRFVARDPDGKQYEAPTLSHNPTIQLQGPAVRHRGQRGEITITSDVDCTAVLTGGEPYITLEEHVVEVRANQAARVRFTATQAGSYVVKARALNREEAPPAAQAPRLDTRQEPIEARYDSRRNETQVNAPVRVMDAQGRPAANVPVDMALAHPGGVEYARVNTDSRGQANFFHTFPGQIARAALSAHVYRVLEHTWKQPPQTTPQVGQTPTVTNLKPGDGISFQVVLNNPTDRAQTAKVQDLVPAGASHLDPGSVTVTGSTTTPNNQSGETTGVYITGITVPPHGTVTVSYSFYIGEGVKEGVPVSNAAWVNDRPTNTAQTPTVSNPATTSDALQSTKKYTGSHPGTVARPTQTPVPPTISKPPEIPTPPIYGPPPPTIYGPPKVPCDCQCHMVLEFSLGAAIQIALAAPSTDQTLEVPLGAKVPLAVNGIDTDLLKVTCLKQGCGPNPCPPCSSVRIIPLPGTLRYRWELVSGPGELISTPPYPHPHSAMAVGPASIYKAPEQMPADPQVTIQLTVEDSPEYIADINDKPVTKLIRFRLVKPGRAFQVPVGPGALPAAPSPATATSDCSCQPDLRWEAQSPITPDKDDETTFAVGVNDYIVLRAGAKDVDKLTLQCKDPTCSSPETVFTLNDALKYRWVQDKGKIIGTSEKVVYQAPANAGKATVRRFVDDSGIHPGPADEPEIEIKPLTIEVFQVTILAAGDYIVPGAGENMVRYKLDPTPVDAVRLEIYDKDSKLLRTIKDLPVANDATGSVEYKWDGLDDAGQHLKQEGSPYRLRVIATKRKAETRDEATAQLKSWKFTYRISDRQPGGAAGESGIDARTVVSTLVETLVRPDGGAEARTPVYQVTEVGKSVDVTLLKSFADGDLLYVYTSPTTPNQINYTITVRSHEGGALDKAGNEWDMDPAKPGIQRTTIWTLRVDENGKVMLIREVIQD